MRHFGGPGGPRSEGVGTLTISLTTDGWSPGHRVDALVFDFDGLILDTEWPAFVTVAEAFAQHGAEMTLERWQSRIGRGDNAPWTELLAGDLRTEIDHVRIADLRRVRKDALTESETVLPGVIELLDAAAERGLPTAVASSSSFGWVSGHLDRLGIADRFSAVRTRDDVVNGKPWPDLFLAAAAGLGVDPAKTVALEDSVHGVTAAKAAGMTCAAVPNRITAGGDFTHADVVLDSLADLTLHR